MAYPADSTFADWPVYCQILDLSTASDAYVAPGAPGRLVRAYVAQSAGTTNSDDIITLKKGSTSIGTITVVSSGSAAGSVSEATMTGSEADCTFAAGDAITVANGGQSDTTSIGRVTLVLRRL